MKVRNSPQLWWWRCCGSHRHYCSTPQRERGVDRVECVEREMGKTGVSSWNVSKLTPTWIAKYRLHSDVEINREFESGGISAMPFFLAKYLEPSSSSSSRRVKETRWQFQSDEGACYSASQARNAWKAKNNWENNPKNARILSSNSRRECCSGPPETPSIHPSIQSAGEVVLNKQEFSKMVLFSYQIWNYLSTIEIMKYAGLHLEKRVTRAQFQHVPCSGYYLIPIIGS